jgi:hypothetical protein
MVRVLEGRTELTDRFFRPSIDFGRDPTKCMRSQLKPEIRSAGKLAYRRRIENKRAPP